MKRVVSLTVAAMLLMLSATWANPCGRGRDCCNYPKGPHPERPGPHQGMKMHDGRPGAKMILAVADEINLTDEQKEKLEQMMVELKLAKVDRKAAVEKAEIRLRVLMRDENASENEVMGAIDEIARLKADLHKMRYNHHKRVRDLLTDEQINRLDELRKERKEKCQEPRPGPHHGMSEPDVEFGFGSEFDD